MHTHVGMHAQLLGGSCTVCTLMPSCVINMCIQRVINQSQWLRFQFPVSWISIPDPVVMPGSSLLWGK